MFDFDVACSCLRQRRKGTKGKNNKKGEARASKQPKVDRKSKTASARIASSSACHCASQENIVALGAGAVDF